MEFFFCSGISLNLFNGSGICGGFLLFISCGETRWPLNFFNEPHYVVFFKPKAVVRKKKRKENRITRLDWDINTGNHSTPNHHT